MSKLGLIGSPGELVGSVMPSLALSSFLQERVLPARERDWAEVHVDFVIASQMPVTCEAIRDKSEERIARFSIKPTFSVTDVTRLKILVIWVRPDGEDRIGTIQSFRDPFKLPEPGSEDRPPISIATGDSKVTRIIMVVESVETTSGKYALIGNLDDDKIHSLAKGEPTWTPSAEFIPKSAAAKETAPKWE